MLALANPDQVGLEDIDGGGPVLAEPATVVARRRAIPTLTLTLTLSLDPEPEPEPKPKTLTFNLTVAHPYP